MSAKCIVISAKCLVLSVWCALSAVAVGGDLRAPRADGVVLGGDLRAPRADGAAVASKPPSRARTPLERRRDGAVPGIVTYDFGKTASGERTHIYRIMGKGGAVLDLTDYGARAVRAYKPGVTGRLTETIGGPDSVIDYEKAGDLAEVYRMKPIRTPDMTGLVFTLETTNGVKKVTHTLDKANLWVEVREAGDGEAPQKVERRL